MHPLMISYHPTLVGVGLTEQRSVATGNAGEDQKMALNECATVKQGFAPWACSLE